MGEIIIPRGIGKPIRGIYSPEVQKIAEALGTVETRRASHVEPTEELTAPAITWLLRHEFGLPEGMPLEPEAANQHRDKLPNAWWADCLPVDGPVLGPFPDRDTALAAESKWLRANNIPTCRACADHPTHDAAASPTGRNPSQHEPQMEMIPRFRSTADPQFTARIEAMLETTRNQPPDPPVGATPIKLVPVEGGGTLPIPAGGTLDKFLQENLPEGKPFTIKIEPPVNPAVTQADLNLIDLDTD